MLIFDNILFASFIPQILMFVGFVSCVVVPFFSLHSGSEVVFTQENKSMEFTVENSQPQSTIYFFDQQDFKAHAVLSDNDETTPFLNISAFKYPLICGFSRLKVDNCTLFSRPPPSFYN